MLLLRLENEKENVMSLFSFSPPLELTSGNNAGANGLPLVGPHA